MTAMTFDTMKRVDALEQADIPRAQARAIVDVVREARDSSDVATKGDLRELEYRIEAHLAKVDGESLWVHSPPLAAISGNGSEGTVKRSGEYPAACRGEVYLRLHRVLLGSVLGGITVLILKAFF